MRLSSGLTRLSGGSTRLSDGSRFRWDKLDLDKEKIRTMIHKYMNRFGFY
ncbi:hypothetical protein [Allobacillus halotolerans]